MKNVSIKLLPALALTLFIVAFTAWWNLFPWNIWSLFEGHQITQIQAVAKEEPVSGMPGMKSEWFACRETSDCDLFRVTCGDHLAANRKYLWQAQNVYCDQAYGCSSLACPGPPRPVVAACEENKCITKSKVSPDR